MSQNNENDITTNLTFLFISEYIHAHNCLGVIGLQLILLKLKDMEQFLHCKQIASFQNNGSKRLCEPHNNSSNYAFTYSKIKVKVYS